LRGDPPACDKNFLFSLVNLFEDGSEVIFTIDEELAFGLWWPYWCK